MDTELMRCLVTLEQINGKPTKEFRMKVGKRKRDEP
jgi:hypothetical protein